MRSRHWIEQELTSGMIGMVHVTKEELNRVPIPVPSLTEQRRIVRSLDKETGHIDSLVEMRKTQAAILEELWLTRLASETKKLIDTYGPIPLQRITTSIEQGWSPQCEDASAPQDDWAVLKTSAVSSGIFLASQHKRLPDDIKPNLRYRITEGDLLITRGSGSPSHVGVTVVAHTEGRKLLLSDLLYRVRLATGWSPEFVALMLQSGPVRGHMSLLFRGQSGQTIKLRAEDIKSIAIPAVPTEEQRRVESKLLALRTQTKEAISAINKSLNALSERRRALITAAVTGRLAG